MYDEASDRKFVKWCVNLDAIIHNIENIIGFEEKLRPYRGPSLFLNGSLSLKFDEFTYKRLFPNAIVTSVEGAAHYVHTDKPKITIESIALFLKSVEQKQATE